MQHSQLEKNTVCFNKYYLSQWLSHSLTDINDGMFIHVEIKYVIFVTHFVDSNSQFEVNLTFIQCCQPNDIKLANKMR